MTSRIVLCCGVGGAGKTTTAAALGLAHAQMGERVVVLTIDPARRLADALGIRLLGNEPQPIPLGEGFSGNLDALMLDRKATWDEVVRRHAPDEQTAARLLANPYYGALSERLTGGHEYMATEKLHALVTAGRWDVVIVDTPPSQHALDFFRAPHRIRRILDQRLLGALFKPSTGLLGVATRRVVGLVRRLAGDAVLDDLSEFFQLVGELSEGFRERGARVQELLTSPDCACLLIAHATVPRTDEMLDFLGELSERGLRFGGCVLNRYTPALEADLNQLATELAEPPAGTHEAAWAEVRESALRLARRHIHRHEVAAEVARRLQAADATPIWRVPDQGRSIDSLDGLRDLAANLPPLVGEG